MSDSDGKLVLVESAGRIAQLRLNRPKKLNALSPALIAAATEAFQRLGGEREISVVVLSGAGRSFSAGADLNALRGHDPERARSFITRLHELMQVIRELPQVVIASIAGYCLGGSCELAAACDIRIAADSARFGMPEIKVGRPSVIEAALFVPLMGLGRAADFVLTGDEMDAVEAGRVGLVTRVVPADVLEQRTAELAAKLAGYSGPALRLQKELIRSWFGEILDAAIVKGIEFSVRAAASPNQREAVDAFREGRAPRFTEL